MLSDLSRNVRVVVSVLEWKWWGDVVLLDMDGGVLLLVWVGLVGWCGCVVWYVFYDVWLGLVIFCLC